MRFVCNRCARLVDEKDVVIQFREGRVFAYHEECVDFVPAKRKGAGEKEVNEL